MNSLTLGAYGYDIVGVEPHSDGEIWNVVNWDLRELLMDRYDHGWGWKHGKHGARRLGPALEGSPGALRRR